VALQVAAQIKAGVVWINCTNLFDAACGFGGYRESATARGGREGLLEYLEPSWFKNAPALSREERAPTESTTGEQQPTPEIDRTVKLYIGGKQARPDSGYSFEVRGLHGELLGEAPLGNRKDIRNAVEAARKAVSWTKTTAHNRAQVLYYVQRISRCTGKKSPAGWRWSLENRRPTRKSLPASSGYSLTRRGPTSSMGRCIARHRGRSQSR